MSDVILCNISDANDVITEARNEWVVSVLLELGVTEEIVFLNDIREFRYNVSEGLGIEVELMSSGEVKIYKKRWHNGVNDNSQGWLPIKKDNLVAHWKQPARIRKVDGEKVFYEIHLNEWSFANAR